MDVAFRASFPTLLARLRDKSTRDVGGVAVSRYDDDLIAADSKAKD